jgi:hypothetical protein
MNMKRLQHLQTVLLLSMASALTLALVAQEPAGEQTRKVEAYYASWVGVQAPEIGDEARDRTTGPAISVESYRGKRLFLIGIEAGNFVEAADEKALLEYLRSLDKVRKEAGKENLAVVGFTRGTALIIPGVKLPEELRRLTDFPMINVVNRKFNEPYNGLRSCAGGIIIDRKGIIQAIFTKAVTEEDLRKAARGGDWEGPPRPAPRSDFWEGKEPPEERARRSMVEVWSQPGAVVVGLATGDWDLDGSLDLLVATAGRMKVLNPEDSSLKEEFPLPGIPGKTPGSVPETVKWAEIEKGKSAVFHLPRGWPHMVPVATAGGSLLWNYPEGKSAGVNSADWVDIDGDGRAELLVGFNGNGGLHLVSSEGKLLWEVSDLRNVRTVAGIGARGEQPGLALCAHAGNDIRVYDAAGRQLRALPAEGHHIGALAAFPMNDQGFLQVLAVREAPVVSMSYAAGLDIEGKLLWKYPVDPEYVSQPIQAADVAEDGMREWIILSRRLGQLLILDAAGGLLLKLDGTRAGWGTGSGWNACCGVSRKGKPRLLCVGGAKGLVTYTFDSAK